MSLAATAAEESAAVAIPNEVEEDSHPVLEMEKIDAKRAKANRKKERKADREQSKIEEREQRKADAGPGARAIELEQLNQLLRPQNLKVDLILVAATGDMINYFINVQVKEVLSDGHCLYRAVADQMLLLLNASSSPSTSSSEAHHPTDQAHHWNREDCDFARLRARAGQHMRDHASDFAPFVGVDEASPEMEDYCRQVEDVGRAEWGGQLELKALASSLRSCICVYEANRPVLKMGEEFISAGVGGGAEAQPIRVSYHKHYYALGEHYNSVVPM